MNSNDLTQPVNNVGSQVSNVNSTIGYTGNEISKSIDNLNATLVISNILLSALVLFLIINTFINRKKNSNKS